MAGSAGEAVGSGAAEDYRGGSGPDGVRFRRERHDLRWQLCDLRSGAGRRTQALHRDEDVMKAAELTGIREFRIVEHELTAPGPGQVQVQVAAVGICGSDMHNFTEG